ncbi:MAG TPA: hypothetical protein VJW20_07775 [Candidatus Angelobacter sp.]|nr:hypothetical protein [Candidatus Angelobacter sp.]
MDIKKTGFARPRFNSANQLRPLRSLYRHCAAGRIIIALLVGVLSGCAALPLKKFTPVVTPPTNSSCAAAEFKLMKGESTNTLHYQLPPVATSATQFNISRQPGTSSTEPLFESYYTTILAAAQTRLPAGLKDHKVTKTLIEWLTSVSAEAQLDAQIADGTVRADDQQVGIERGAIKKHSDGHKLTHGDLKDFSNKLFDLHLKPGAAALITQDSSNSTFIKYFEAYYKGNFVDRMGTSLDKPQISSTVPDSEIVAAETVLLEFLIDLIDPTPVMGSDAVVTKTTIFYPGNSTKQPTAYSVDNYVQIPPGSATACGITAQNVWVLRDLANGASSQAAAVGGLVENTAGGISIGLGVLGKISIGDNQTLGVMVKTAASRIALRAALASSYWTLRHVKFNVDEP